MLAAWFANPDFLWTLLAAPCAFALMLFAYLRRRQLTARLATPLLLRKSVSVRPRVRRWKALCVLIGLALLAFAAAGPQWGLDESARIRQGRDVVLVLDLSRSMSAGQPSRRELALHGLRQLADEFERHGGNRVALVVFAAQPKLLFPFTHDCDHLRHTLAQIEADDIAKLSLPEPVSGTRIGAALKLAVESCDPAQSRRSIIVLLSDGDDPADDGEWKLGAQAAHERSMPVHVFGFGDPQSAETIPAGNDVLEFDGKPIRTRLEESPLRAIALQSDGQYVPAREETLPLGTFVLHLLDAERLSADAPADGSLRQLQLRYVWFLLTALLLLVMGLLPQEGIWAAPRKSASLPRSSRALALALALAALICVSAAEPPEAESLFRQGTEALERQEYNEALRYFEKAEALTHDPGRVAFNKAAAYYRLGQYREAIDSWRRCLADDAAPAERRARARFDLGNALVQYAGEEPTPLAEAVASYRACLLHADLPDKLRVDARHNLEIAQMRWLEALKKQPDAKGPSKPKPPEYPEESGKDPNKKEIVYAPVEPQKGPRDPKSLDAKPGGKSETLRQGLLNVVPDTDQLVPLVADDALALLAREARRIAEERRGQRNPAGPRLLTVKDW